MFPLLWICREMDCFALVGRSEALLPKAPVQTPFFAFEECAWKSLAAGSKWPESIINHVLVMSSYLPPFLTKLFTDWYQVSWGRQYAFQKSNCKLWNRVHNTGLYYLQLLLIIILLKTALHMMFVDSSGKWNHHCIRSYGAREPIRQVNLMWDMPLLFLKWIKAI